MPQMSPMNWLIIMIVMITILFMVFCKFFYQPILMSSGDKDNYEMELKSTSYLNKWMW